MNLQFLLNDAPEAPAPEAVVFGWNALHYKVFATIEEAETAVRSLAHDLDSIELYVTLSRVKSGIETRLLA